MNRTIATSTTRYERCPPRWLTSCTRMSSFAFGRVIATVVETSLSKSEQVFSQDTTVLLGWPVGDRRLCIGHAQRDQSASQLGADRWRSLAALCRGDSGPTPPSATQVRPNRCARIVELVATTLAYVRPHPPTTCPPSTIGWSPGPSTMFSGLRSTPPSTRCPGRVGSRYPVYATLALRGAEPTWSTP